jgi:hypothetical protein
MYRDLLGMVKPIGDVRLRTYWWYLHLITIEPPISELGVATNDIGS